MHATSGWAVRPWGHDGVTMGSRWGHDGVTMGSRWGHDGVTMGSRWGHDGVTMGSRWGHDGVTMGSRWGHGRAERCVPMARASGATSRDDVMTSETTVASWSSRCREMLGVRSAHVGCARGGGPCGWCRQWPVFLGTRAACPECPECAVCNRVVECGCVIGAELVSVACFVVVLPGLF
jgi:hypothetical protein